MSDQTTDVYLGKVRNAWGRSDEIVAGSMVQAKADIEDRARELASFTDEASLPDEADWRAHSVEEGTQVWDVPDWQIVVQTHQIEETTADEAVTDGGRDMTEWECGNCGDSFETPGEPELPCLQCGADDWQEVDAQ